MLQLIGVLPLSRTMRRHCSNLVAQASKSVSAAGHARSRVTAIVMQPPTANQRYLSTKKKDETKRPVDNNDEKKKEMEEVEDSSKVAVSNVESVQEVVEEDDDMVNEDEDEIEIEEMEASFPASFEKALVKATVPDIVPELISLPIDRRPVFPGFYKTFYVKDERVAAALTRALKRGKPYVGLFLSRSEEPAQQQQHVEGGPVENHPDNIKSLDEVHQIGTFAQIVNLIPGKGAGLDGEGLTAIVYPHRRIRAVELLPESPEGVSRVKVENVPLQPYTRQSQVLQALMQEVFVMLSEVAKLNPFFREHITHHNVSSSVFEEPAKLADFVAVLTSGPAAELQDVLETDHVEARLRKSLILLKKELMTAELQSTIRKDVESKLNKKQREYMLHEQLKTIKKELGLETDTKEKLTEMFTDRASKLDMPEDVKRVFDEELSKLSVLEPAGSEFNLTRNYLEWITSLPWNKFSADSFDLARAHEILEEDHYGLKDVKDRILEFIAVSKLRGAVSGKILCLVGPPGVGKTSIGRSIARSLGRQYYRFSVGGLSDVAEIKGHRRTYVGAMPGKVVQAMKKVQTSNPMILIDEIDKLGRGHQGDPASALLELLDPEQNSSFLDHYLDVPLDLSKVLFVCTANTTDTIPAPLLDRMEVINLSGYVAQEKMEIAQRYLIPAAREAAGVTEEQVKITKEAIETLNRQYCRESGVRNLKKHVEKLFRKAALKLVQENPGKLEIGPEQLKEYVGSPVFTSEKLYEGKMLPPGVVTGLAWTSMGGSILYMETILEKFLSPTTPTSTAMSSSPSPSGGSLIRTGQLGKVMEESSTIAYSYAKAFMTKYYPESAFFQNAAIHLHVPEGATPKDGPSAGSTMTTALLSLALGRPVRADLAMTGELSLTGKVLRIGGVKEKIIAAKRADIKTVLLPASNKSDWDDLPEYVKEGVEAHFVEEFPEIARLTGLLPESVESA